MSKNHFRFQGVKVKNLASPRFYVIFVQHPRALSPEGGRFLNSCICYEGRNYDTSWAV